MWCRSFVEISTKLRPPKCPGLVEVWSKFGRSLVEVLCRSLVNILLNLLRISLIYRANFDQTSTLGVSKFGRSLVEVWSKLVEVWSKFGRSLVEVSTLGVSQFGRNFDQTSTPQSKFGLIDDDRNNQTIAYVLKTNVYFLNKIAY